ncbi:Pyrimidine deaminase domain of riboflavin biosynthesis protein RibD [Nostoc flagelliforme CCNUN1]|uniref:Pyrimidine deaminase domain of riboflavin biosynthesis protein RibD n=2 Tax=Nostoc flagelliforme TaxID=1306274 RepID=A0A2K8T1A2_9NOSO|nr:Pyrimidine deaminase domain of riboflavin biosynthesis protein RibD [Nostoc flagelliforme CCNUN1]
MLAALAQSRKALPECLPNPPVGCVIIDAQEIVAQGYTQAPGKHHAEADALNQIQAKAFSFLKMYVTLEPCFFHGRTPACALAIAGVAILPSIILTVNVTNITTFSQ